MAYKLVSAKETTKWKIEIAKESVSGWGVRKAHSHTSFRKTHKTIEIGVFYFANGLFC